MAKIKSRSKTLIKEKNRVFSVTFTVFMFSLLLVCFYMFVFDDIGVLGKISGLILIVFAFYNTYKLYQKYKIVKAGIDGEKEVKQILKQLKDITIYSNVPITYNQNKSEIDYLCISEKGLFIVEVKNYSGNIKGKYDDVKWKQYKTQETKEVKNPVKQLTHQMKILNSILKENNIDTYIEGCVFFNKAKSIECKDKKIITDSKELLNRINNQKQSLSKKDIKKIMKVL